MSAASGGGYAGDVSSSEAWEVLARDPAATLIDVRTKAEWAYVGLPAIESLGKSLVTIEWHAFPSTGVDPDFTKKLAGVLDERGISRDAPLYFICRSGARSRSAAISMSKEGYSQAFNVADGFEGPLDKNGHRGTTTGWKAEGLPWVQS
jgi:rhodanese-related sulfurtransferase